MKVSMSLKLTQYSAAAAMFSALVACTGGSSDSSGSPQVPPPVRQAGISVVAGAAWSYAGAVDGTLDVAKFNKPSGVTLDRSGTQYVVDAANYTVRKISVGGQVSTLAGKSGEQGAADGSGAQARFSQVFDIAVDNAGNLYVTDAGALRKITPDGVVSTLVTAASGFLISPGSVAVDAASNIYVADVRDLTIRKITPGGVVITLAGQSGVVGSADGAGSAAQFTNPSGLVVDVAGNLLVADQHTLRKISPAGVVTTIAGDAAAGGVVDGLGRAARFERAGAIAIDAQGVLYVTDYPPIGAGASVIRKVLPSGLVSTLALDPNWRGYADHVAVDADGNLLVSDSRTDAIQKVTPGGQTTAFAGGARAESASRDGAALTAHFNGIRGVTADKGGNYYVTDGGNCSVRKIAPLQQVTTLAGTAGACGRADGVGPAARFKLLGDLSSDPGGNLYASDGGTVRKIAADGMVITLAGSGDGGGVKKDGVGAAAVFNFVKSLSSDTKGKLFVSDGQTYCAHREGMFVPTPVPSTLRTVSPDGTVLSLAYASASATAVALTDGSPAVATLGCVSAIKHDGLDNLYFVDGVGEGPFFLRKRAADGILSTLGRTTFPLTLAGNQGVYLAPDELGNLYVGNFSGVYRVSAQGVTSRIFGAQAAPGDALTLPAGIKLDTINGLHYLGNKQLLVVTGQVVLKIDLP